MKKSMLVLLAVLLLIVSGIAVMADENSDTYEENGFTLTYTEEFDADAVKGVFYPYPFGADSQNGTGYMEFYYFAMPKDEFDTLMNKENDEWTEEDQEYFHTRQGTLLSVVSLNGGRGMTELLDTFFGGETDADITEVGKAGETTFFAMEDPGTTDGYLAGIEPEYQEEFKTLQEALLEVLKNGQYSEPVFTGGDLVGTTLHFEASDVDGNTVGSEDIFKENEITMINIWATWCGNCKREMPELVEMSHRLAEKNVGVIGICMDADTELETCKDLIEEYDVDFLNLLPYEGINEDLEIACFPISYFVDSEGTILSLPFKGAPQEMSAYEEVIDGLLSGGETELDSSDPVHITDDGIYRVIVMDQDGDPAEDVMVQFCSDTECMMGKTDENGIAEFAADEGVYQVHMLKVPEEYESTSEEYTTADTYCDVYVVLQKAA